jgi:hypothetical protein
MSTKRPFRFRVGQDLATGDPVFWSQRDLRYGGFLTVAARGGKTTLAARLLGTLITRGAPAIVLDDAGELWHQLERAVAWEAHRTNELLKLGGFTSRERRVVIRRKFLDRFSFGFLGVGRKPNQVALDILKRRRLPHRRESIEEVVSGNLKPFEARFKDLEIRTRFLSVITPCLAALVAAERPITEAWNLLLDPAHWYFVRSEIVRLRVLDDAVSYAYLVPQMQKLRRILDLRMTKTKNGPVEAEPFPQAYRDKVESTLHAIEVYTPGTVSSTMFTHDSFSPESVAFGRGVFALTSDVTSELNRNLAISTIYTTFERLLKYRVPGQGNARYRLYLAIDEVRWMYETITRFLSTLNNHRVSAWVLNQDDHQWAALGMPTLAKILPKLLAGVRMRDAAGSREIADEMALLGASYDPFGVQKTVVTTTTTASRTVDESEGETESEGEMESESEQAGTSRRSGWTESSSEQDGEGASWDEEGLHLQHSASGSSGSSSGKSGDEGASEGRGHATGRSSTRGWTRGRRRGSSSSESAVEHLLTVGAAEQHLLRMQEEMHLPRYTVQLRTADGVRHVKLAPPAHPWSKTQIEDLVAEFEEASAAHHRARIRPRRAYNPAIVLARRPVPPAETEQAEASTAAVHVAATPADDCAQPTTESAATEPPSGPRPSFTRRRRSAPKARKGTKT